MSQEEIITTVEELQELRRMQEELEAEIEAAQERIKTHMLVNGAETLTAGAWKVSYKAVTCQPLRQHRVQEGHARPGGPVHAKHHDAPVHGAVKP